MYIYKLNNVIYVCVCMCACLCVGPLYLQLADSANCRLKTFGKNPEIRSLNNTV